MKVVSTVIFGASYHLYIYIYNYKSGYLLNVMEELRTVTRTCSALVVILALLRSSTLLHEDHRILIFHAIIGLPE